MYSRFIKIGIKIMQINNIATTPKDNNLHFGAIKKINYLGEYSKYPEFGKELLSILKEYSPSFDAFSKKYDVDITFYTCMSSILDTPIRRMGYYIGDKFHIQNMCHIMHLDAHIPNLSFFKSLFTKNKKVELDIVTFKKCFNLSPIWAPSDTELFETVKKVNNKLAEYFNNRRWLLYGDEGYELGYTKVNNELAEYLNELAECFNNPRWLLYGDEGYELGYTKFKTDGKYKFINAAQKNKHSLSTYNDLRYRMPFKIREQLDPHFFGYCSNCGYYPNGNLKTYIYLGDDVKMYGECYKNGKKKCELISKAKSIVHGRGVIEHTNTIEVNLYRENGSLCSKKKFDSKDNITSLLEIYIPSFGTPKKILSKEEQNILQACGTLQAREENKKQPFISTIARTINDNTWLLSDSSVLIKENGKYERITPKMMFIYDENLDEIVLIDEYGSRIP